MAIRMMFFLITQNVFPPYSNTFVCLLTIKFTFINFINGLYCCVHLLILNRL